ncbi:g4724 [Coccomyxa viridis]|uniref:G4724 protein n=1 Tax=Coccomyxa viridis TaxID=1274662 RepID=A0ABP1FQZ8_9CHLO
MTFSHYSLDVSGWQSSLKRCIGATSMTIYLRSPRTADALLHALQIQQTKGNLQSVRELRYSGHHCGGDAFVTLAAMCPNIQVMNLYTTDPLSCFPITASNLRHLILWTRDLPSVVGRLMTLPP